MRKYLFFRIAIVLLCIPGVAGFSVSSVTGIPPGNPDDLTPVTVTCEIPRTGILVYDQLVFTTGLSSPVWEPVVIVHDSETPVTPAVIDGNRLVLNGAALNFPEPVPAKLRVSVSGTMPANHTADQVLLDIRQIDSAGTPYAYPAGNYTVPMPGASSLPAPESSAISVPTADTTYPEYTVPTMPAPVMADPSSTVPVPEAPMPLPSPLPDRTPAATVPSEPLLVAGAAGIAAFIVRKSKREEGFPAHRHPPPVLSEPDPSFMTDPDTPAIRAP